MKTIYLLCALPVIICGQTLNRFGYAEILLNTYNYHEAALLMDGVKKDSPLSASDRLFIASVYSLDHQPDKAIFYLKQLLDTKDTETVKMIRENKDLTNLHSDKRWDDLINEKQQKTAALTEIKKVLQKDSSVNLHAIIEKMFLDSSHYSFDIDKINSFAQSLFKTQLPVSIRLLNEVNRFFPGNIETGMLLGEAYEQSGDRLMARQLYEETLLLKPDATTTYILLKKISILQHMD